MHFLGVHSVNAVLQLGGPPVDAETSALVGLKVGPEAPKAVASHHIVRIVQFVAFFELLVHKWVVNSRNGHVVQ